MILFKATILKSLDNHQHIDVTIIKTYLYFNRHTLTQFESDDILICQ
jgi:hypothetical protein